MEEPFRACSVDKSIGIKRNFVTHEKEQVLKFSDFHGRLDRAFAGLPGVFLRRLSSCVLRLRVVYVNTENLSSPPCF